ncbi:MAG: lipopolysaccharide kinase InaA family protein [Planctomycetota bacterium]|nr:lipopolysaccharide kinase InaA family protein [Planctomycetota bacterium]
MSEFWNLLQADEQERELFPGLEATLAMASDLAAPPNRFREVRKITRGSRNWYLKIFHRTQFKNRLRSRLTAPHSNLDGQRECKMAEALLRHGIETARPVAIGQRRASSFYLCAELPGETMREAIEAGRCGRQTAHEIARFVGKALFDGLILPDSSADHVYIQAGGTKLAILDLHNGSLRKPRNRDLTRILKHFRRSLRSHPITPRQAMGFAARLCKAAGFQTRTRKLLSRLPPLDTHTRYDAPGKSTSYRSRNPGRTARELACLRRVWPGEPGEMVLDAPCGTGRLGPTLDDLKVRRIGLDRSVSMLRAGLPSKDPLLLADMTRLPIGDRGVDGVVLFRFLHHLPPADARDVLAEACRVAGRFLVVSFFHPISTHGFQRRLTQSLTRRPRTRHAITASKLCKWLATSGFYPTSFSAELPYLKDLWVGSFERRD